MTNALGKPLLKTINVLALYKTAILYITQCTHNIYTKNMRCTIIVHIHDTPKIYTSYRNCTDIEIQLGFSTYDILHETNCAVMSNE